MSPEAQVGGPIALIQDGDVIVIDADKKVIQAQVSDQEFAKRRQEWTAPAYKFNKGTLYKFIKNVNSASLGCTTDN